MASFYLEPYRTPVRLLTKRSRCGIFKSIARENREGEYMAMASVMLPLGTPAPPFSLRDVVSGNLYSLNSFSGKAALLVMFICRHCPYVQHVEQELAKIGRDYADTGLGIIGISSNDPVQYPDDAPPRLKEMAERLAFTFPFCFDETQDVRSEEHT